MNVKSFSTLNRFLGKKKDKNLSKSTTNLQQTKSSLDSTISSHLQQQNRIAPLPVATSNTPFEQTFRIKVLLPKDQFFVTRLGAKIKLEKLLELVCENKQLNPQIYEFRHPTDTSQVFSLESTIGSVGLTEIRLCHKSEAYDSFNSDEILKMRHQTVCRDSLSSSELSGRKSHNALKTPSPYSSTNSLNSMDSTGMNTNYRAPISLPPYSAAKLPPVAPTRKKRMAPRPPVQNSIPESAPATSPTVNTNSEFKKPLPKKEFHESTPNLSNGLKPVEFHRSSVSIDCSQENTVLPNGPICNGSLKKIRPMSMQVLNGNEMIIIDQKKRLSTSSFESVQSLTRNDSRTEVKKNPEPSPRKKVAAPAPPPRSIVSPSSAAPVATPRMISMTLLNSSTTKSINLEEEKDLNNHHNGNVSKVMLNQSKSDISITSPRSPSSESKDFPTLTEAKNCTSITEKMEYLANSPDNSYDDTDIDSKQTDSGIGELVPHSPLPDSLAETELSEKSPFESDEDDNVKVYNLKTGKSMIKPIIEHKTLDNLTSDKTGLETSITAQIRNPNENSSVRADSPNWTYTIPAPPNFADCSNCDEPLSVKSESSSTESAADEQDSNSKSRKNEVDNQVENSINKLITQGEKNKEENNKKKIETTLVNSDIEDGYRGGNIKLLHSGNETRVEENRKCFGDLSGDYSAVNENHEEIVKDFIIIPSSDNFSNDSEPPLFNCASIKQDEIGTPEIYKSTNSEVISELSSVLNEDYREVMKKSEEKENEIQLMPCNLSNFKLKTYSPPASPIKMFYEEHQQAAKATDEDKVYRKRFILPNSNSIKTKRNMTRSDSFHCTQHSGFDQKEFPSRSSSFLSLLAAQKQEQKSIQDNRFLDANRNKSSSELSIGESPSLQSLIVMKSILNSRKNSLNNEIGVEPISLQNETKHINEDNLKENDSPELEPEKKWKYQGPPSINLSTWSERPKIQPVAIKNEGDYIFGGSSSVSNNTTSIVRRDYRKSMPSFSLFQNGNNDLTTTEQHKLPFVRSFELKKLEKAPTPPPKPLSAGNTMTLGRFKTPVAPTVKGFQSLDVKEGIVLKSNATNSLGRNKLHSSNQRHSYYGGIENQIVKRSEEQSIPAFAQVTLRKTGLKDKMCETPIMELTTKKEQSAKLEMKVKNETERTNQEFIKNNVEFLVTSKQTLTPPPPPPIIRSVVTKQNATTIMLNPRDNLLSSIRGFDRETLKRS